MIRYLSTRLVHHGRYLWRHQRRQIHTKIVEKTRKRRPNAPRTDQQVVRYKEPFQRYGFSRVLLHARKLLLDNVVNRPSSNPLVDLPSQMVKKPFYRDSVPIVAFVGIAAAAEGAILLEDAELEETCWKIRDTVEKLRPSWDEADASVRDTPIGLEDLEIGSPIAKGCSAVVHEAAIKRHPQEFSINRSYPLALKIMFNYDVQSNALAIVRAMFRDTVPARHRALEIAGFWQHLADQATLLPPHPNVVSMLGVFCAQMPSLEGAHTLYPSALPPRLHESGFGRNMSLFLLMRRYHCSLADFLGSQGGKTSARWALLLFAQLLEAVAHLNRYGVAHRDLKSDNILIDVGTDGAPGLVVADFGCCVADKRMNRSVKTTFPCSVCKKTYLSLRFLKRHKCNTEERPYKCTICSKAFKQKKTLDDHQAVHSEKRTRYSCTDCEKKFNWRSGMRKHMLKHHGKTLQTGTTKPHVKGDRKSSAKKIKEEVLN